MRTNHSNQNGRGGRVSQPASRPHVSGAPRETACNLPNCCQAETAFETLFACSPLTHHLTMVLQAGGVGAAVVPSPAGPGEATIHIPAGDKNAAIEILLRTLHDTQSSSGSNVAPAIVLAA